MPRGCRTLPARTDATIDMSEATSSVPPGDPGRPWDALAEHWKRLDSPLRPAPEDLARLQAVWLESLPTDPPARRLDVLLLGVTPEFALFPWAPEVQLTAVDSSETVIKAVWPGDGPGRQVRRGEWLHLPFGPATFDLILCDNGPTLFNGLKAVAGLGRALRRVLRSDGRVVMRNFARPARPEPVESAVADVWAGRVRNFHAFKMRFLMALQGDTAAAGVRLGEAWERFNGFFPDRAALAASLGCRERVVATIDAYRGQEARYSFYSLAEVADGFPGFRLIVGPPGSYPFAECCPVFALVPEP